MYDFYMYHGGTPEGFNGVNVKIIIKYDNLDETEEFSFRFLEKFNLNAPDRVIYRQLIERCKLKKFNN